MLSLPNASTAGAAFLLFYSPLLLFLFSSSVAQGAALREHRLRGSEWEPQGGVQSPNVDMLKALEYIESLRQKTSTDPQQQSLLSPESDADVVDDTEKLRSMLLASPAQSQGQDRHTENEEEEENEDDKTEEWVKAVLSTLQQTEKASASPSAAVGKSPRSEMDEEVGGDDPWVHQQHGARSHRNHPLMFEEDEEEEEEDKKGTASNHGAAFKRTNENVEEKYTPQNLATLQSVFEELGRLANAETDQKRQIEDEEEDMKNDNDEDDEDGDDMFNVGDMAYEDVAGGEDWNPLEEEDEDDEEEDSKRLDFDRELDYGNGEEEENDNEDAEEGENYLVKRSSQTGSVDDPDDMTRLVDYFLLKVLEKTEEEEQKRELEEEEEEEEKRAVRRMAQWQHGDTMDPQVFYRLLQISRKIQIPQEDLLNMLKMDEMNKDRTLLQTQSQARRPSELSKVKDKLSQISKYKKTKTPLTSVFNRPDAQTTIPEDINTAEILKILGLGSVGNQNSVPVRKQKLRNNSQSQFLDRLREDYDDTVDEDELAAYLAAQMLARYPDTAYKADQKRGFELNTRDEDEQIGLGSFEQALQDYFDQMNLGKNPPQERRAETEAKGKETQNVDDEALMKMFSYLNPENDETEDKDTDVSVVKGM